MQAISTPFVAITAFVVCLFAGPKSDSDPAPPKGMIFVPDGTSYIGDTENELKALFKQMEKKEPPADYWTSLVKTNDQHRTLGAYFLDKTEVTNGQFDIFLKATNGTPPTIDLGNGRILTDWEPTADGKGLQLKKGRENHPVFGVSYFEAVNFARWAGKRLPTEFEWERAARGDDTRRYPWGNQWHDIKYCNSALYGRNDTTPVGSFPEGVSPFGAFDMAGNVWEWTSSTFELYAGNARQTGVEGGITIRGGGFVQVPSALRASVRAGAPPNFRTAALGFRCAKSVQPAVDALTLTAEALRGVFPPEFKFDPAHVIGIEQVEYAPGTESISRYKAIGVLPRVDAQFNSQRNLETVHKNKKQPIPLFVFRTDVDLENPKIPAGQYLVLYDAPGSIQAPAKTTATEEKKDGEDAPSGEGKKEEEAGEEKKPEGESSEEKPPAPAEGGEGGEKKESASEELPPPLPKKSAEEALDVGALAKESTVPRLVFMDAKGHYRAEIVNPTFGSEADAKSEVAIDGAKKTLNLRVVPRFHLRGKELVFEHKFNIAGW